MKLFMVVFSTVYLFSVISLTLMYKIKSYRMNLERHGADDVFSVMRFIPIVNTGMVAIALFLD